MQWLTDEAGAGQLGEHVVGPDQVPAAVGEEGHGVAVLQHHTLRKSLTVLVQIYNGNNVQEAGVEGDFAQNY